MLFGRLLRHQQHEHLLDGFAIGRVKRNRLQRSNKSAGRAPKALDPSGGNGYALAQAGRPETLAREEAVEDDRARDLRVVLEQLADLLEQPLFARRVHVERDIRLGQEIRDVGHRWYGTNAIANRLYCTGSSKPTPPDSRGALDFGGPANYTLART